MVAFGELDEFADKNAVYCKFTQSTAQSGCTLTMRGLCGFGAGGVVVLLVGWCCWQSRCCEGMESAGGGKELLSRGGEVGGARVVDIKTSIGK